MKRSIEYYNLEDDVMNDINAKGGAVVSHSHLDRAYTLTEKNLSESNHKLYEKWDLVSKMKREMTKDDIENHIKLGLELLISQNVQAVGSFIDVDPVIGSKSLDAALKVKEEYKDRIKLILINQTLQGVLNRDARYWFDFASERVDIIGGLPGKDSNDKEKHIDTVLKTAKKHKKLAHIHIDQFNTPTEDETSLLAKSTIANGMEGRVALIHGISIASHKINKRKEIYSLMKDAGLMVVTCPRAYLDAVSTEEIAVTHNSVTPVREMFENGIETISMGVDNIRDIYLPLENGNIKENIASLACQQRILEKEALVRILGGNGLKVLGLKKPEMNIKSNIYSNLVLAAD